MALAWLPDAQNEIFAEDEVTLSSLGQIFRQAFFKVSIEKDRYLRVHTDGPPVIVSVDQEIKLIRFMSIYGVKESAPLELKHAYVNKMNDDLILARFTIPESQPDVVIANYHMTFENSLSPFQMVCMLRFFARVVSYAVRTRDENDLLE